MRSLVLLLAGGAALVGAKPAHVPPGGLSYRYGGREVVRYQPNEDGGGKLFVVDWPGLVAATARSHFPVTEVYTSDGGRCTP